MSITVYTKPSCVQCNATYRALDAKGIEYQITDLSEDASALEQVNSMVARYLRHLAIHLARTFRRMSLWPLLLSA